MPWGDLIAQARRSLSDPNFGNRERVYKLQIAEAIGHVLEMAERGEDWTTGLRRALGRTYGPFPPFRGPYNLTRFSQHQWLHKLTGEPAEEARVVLAGMRGQADPIERFAAFADLASRHADKGGAQPGSILAFGSVLNMATDPTQLPPIKTTVFKDAEDDVGFPRAPDDVVEAYAHHLQFVDACRKEIEEAGLAVQDRLDIQSILWEWQRRGDESSSALHILQRWSSERDPDTVEKHRAAAEEHGVVWWGRLGDPEGRAAIGAPRLKELQAQLDAGTPTYVFLHRTGEVWRTRLVEIRTDRPVGELELIPEYYRDVVGEHHLWLKLKDFKKLEPDYAENHLVMDDSDGPESISHAFKGQQSFLYVRLKDGETPGAQRVWWVNQGATYNAERDGEFMWAPLESAAGQQLFHWESMKDVRVGDVVLHYANTQIRAVGEVLEEAKEATRPESLGAKGGAWSEEGRLVGVRYHELAEPISLDKIPPDWRIEHGAPFTRHGSVHQGYLFSLRDDFVAKLAGRFPELGLSAIGGGGENGTGESYAEPAFAEILKSVRKAGLKISEDELRRYHLSLKLRGFVILAGISGSGKTWLTELYAKAIGANHHLEAVAPNWTTNEDLLGYLNPLTDSYQYTSFTEFLREAAAEWESAKREKREATPFHVTLDEMNLARVEYYFAKFLSAMEERARDKTATIELAPGYSVLLTPNLRFSGTVNVDETTHVFADKVYDRAQLVTLTPSRDAIKSHMDGRPYQDTLIGMWDAVHVVAPFGYRVLDDIADYVTKSNDLGVTWEQALDEQLMQKVLPKLKGADQRVRSCLSDLVELTESSFPLTHAKATAMRDEFAANGFASYF
jgi:hypothetical protein